MSRKIQSRGFGYIDDFAIPDFDFPSIDIPDFDFNFDIPDFNFDFDFEMPSFDFDFELPNFGVDADNLIPSDAFDGQYFDTGAVPDFDIEAIFSGDFTLPNFDAEALTGGDIGIFPGSGVPPVLDETGAISGGAGESIGSLFKTVGQLAPVIKTAAGLFFSYQKSTNPTTGRTQYAPRQITSAQAQQVLAMQQAAQRNQLNAQQAAAYQQYTQQLRLQNSGGLSSQTLLFIVGGIAALGVVLALRK